MSYCGTYPPGNYIREKIENKPLDVNDDIIESWEKWKRNIYEAATEAVRIWKTNQGKSEFNKNSWFGGKVKKQCKEKIESSLKI